MSVAVQIADANVLRCTVRADGIGGLILKGSALKRIAREVLNVRCGQLKGKSAGPSTGIDFYNILPTVASATCVTLTIAAPCTPSTSRLKLVTSTPVTGSGECYGVMELPFALVCTGSDVTRLWTTGPTASATKSDIPGKLPFIASLDRATSFHIARGMEKVLCLPSGYRALGSASCYFEPKDCEVVPSSTMPKPECKRFQSSRSHC